MADAPGPGAASRVPADSGDLRYGVFLIPDAQTSAAVTAITNSVRFQYGLMSAARFPPHITLAGSLPLAVGEDALLATIEKIAGAHRPFPIHNRGISRLGEATVVFDVHDDAAGRANAALVSLTSDVVSAVMPLLREADGLPADVRGSDEWHGHVSLASHELGERADLCDEVENFIRELDQPYPRTFPASRLTVYRLRHASWSGPWWIDFTWEHLRSFPLADRWPSAHRQRFTRGRADHPTPD